MDSSGATPTMPLPRLRLSRLGPKYDDDLNTPQAGPSRLSPNLRTPIGGHDDSENGDDAQSTPRMPLITSIPLEPSSINSATPTAETPSARLRALLSRVQQSPSTARPVPAPPSEPDSDFDPPRSSPLNTPSIARESIKDMFSRALRDPGDTPQKKGRRRNSIDISEVEASPRVEQERARNRGQRRSLSDEEPDNPSRSVASSRSSQAATFDILRARLANSQTQIMNQYAPFDDQSESGVSDMPADHSENDSFLRDLEQTPATPPAATSTPHRSVQMPSQMQFHSNLLEHDSDMHNAMRDFDSFEGASGPSRPVSFPPARASQSTSARPLSRTSGSKVHSSNQVQGNRPRALSKTDGTDLNHSGPSHTSSSLSQANLKEKDEGHAREREWNKPHPQSKTPDIHHHSHSHGSNSSGGIRSGSPMLNSTHVLARRGSITSLRSTDDGRSSRGSSFGSQAEYRERINELEKERNIEREREWNKRQPSSRPTSSMSMNSHSPRSSFERSRTQSQPMRPDSSLRHTPDRTHNGLYRFSSPGSRASSPGSSMSHSSEKERELEVKHEIEHSRERNWNSPRPKWDSNDRAVSPLPTSLSPRPSISHSHSLSHSLRTSRAESPTQHLQGRKTLRSSLSHSSVSLGDKDKLPPRAVSPSPQGGEIASSSTLLSDIGRPRSYSQTKDTGTASSAGISPSKTPASGSRFGWQFPRNKTQLPPLEYDEHSPERQSVHSRTLSSPSPSPGSGPLHRSSAKASHIPVRSHHTPDASRTMASNGGPSRSGPGVGHKGSITELNVSRGGIPPRIDAEPVSSVEEDGHHDVMFASDEDPPSPLPVTAVSLQPVEASEAEEPLIFSPPVSPASKSAVNNDKARLHRTITPSPPASPTPSPPPPLPELTLSLATPPRPRSANSSKPEFQTPPPPEGLPDLPGPPSDDESEPDWTPEPPTHLDFSTMKTPRPPGAWAFTPVASRREPLARASTLPDSDTFGGGGESASENGLATPLPSLSRAFTLPPQTPAPPGAWLATPGSERRRSVLKVRFDMESEQSASESANGNGHLGDSDGLRTESPSDLDLTPTIKPQTILPSPIEIKEEEVPVPVTPRSTPPSTIRRSPIVRVVDAFGREHKVPNGDAIPELAVTPPVPATPRSKSSVRIVDAMGREVEESVEEAAEAIGPESEDEFLSHNEALRRVRQSIADLALGLSDVENSSHDIDPEDDRVKELNSVSQAARDARLRLSETLRLARKAEDHLRSRIRLNKIPSAFQSRLPWHQNNTLIFWGAVALQLILILVMYRISTTRAKDLFLSTYYDPYYPELHLYAIKPDTIRISMNHATRWSILSIPEALHRGGLKAVAADAWNGLAMVIYDWQRQIWDTWGAPEAVSWPPT